jgi:steroid delta-isomerase-like uncharacterized protein
MSADAIHSAVERMNAGDLDGYMEVYADDVELHGYPPDVEGREGARAFYAQLREAFPDLSLEVYGTVEQGDLVAARYALSGTHSAEFFGVPAMGREVRVEGQSIFRFRDGQIVVRWQALDELGLLTQLGAPPNPA